MADSNGWRPAPVRLDPNGNYRIELHQQSIAGSAAHNYWLLRNSGSGQIEGRLHRYATDPNSNQAKVVGSSADVLRFRRDRPDPNEKDSQPILTTGAYLSAQQVEERWNAAVASANELNDKNIPYSLFGGDNKEWRNTRNEQGDLIETRQVISANSNGAAYTAGLAMGIPAGEMKSAVEGSGKISPGFGRDLIDEYRVPPPPSYRGREGRRGEREPPADQPDAVASRDPAPPSNNDRTDRLRERFASKLLEPDSEAEEILLKPARDWTEPEMKSRIFIGAATIRSAGTPTTRRVLGMNGSLGPMQ